MESLHLAEAVQVVAAKVVGILALALQHVAKLKSLSTALPGWYVTWASGAIGSKAGE